MTKYRIAAITAKLATAKTGPDNAKDAQDTQPIGALHGQGQSAATAIHMQMRARPNDLSIVEKQEMDGKRAVCGGLRTVNYVNSHVPWVYRCPLVVCGCEHNKGRIINPHGLKRNLLTHIFQQRKSLPQPLLDEVYNKDRVKTQTIYVPQPRAHATAKSYHKSLTGVDSQESKKGVSPGTVDAENMEVLDFDGDMVARAKTCQPTIQEMFRGMTAKERSNEEADHEEMQESQQERQQTTGLNDDFQHTHYARQQ